MTFRMWFTDAGLQAHQAERPQLSALRILDGYFEDLSRRLGVNISELDIQFTVNANYRNVLVEF